jgi:hypothetical protein
MYPDQNHNRAPSTREAALRGLALVGFIVLLALGIWLMVYLVQSVPGAMHRLGAAGVAFTSLFQNEDEGLVVVTAGTTTATFPEDTRVSASTTTSTPPQKPAPKPVAVAPAPKPETTVTTPITETPLPPALTGLPDLVTTITATGYLASSTLDSFVASSTNARGTRSALTFTVRNAGTNIALADWKFTAAIPTQSGYVFTSPPQQSLKPGESIAYTLGFDQALPGANRSLSIRADAENRIAESNENNNSATTQITIAGN